MFLCAGSSGKEWTKRNALEAKGQVGASGRFHCNPIRKREEGEREKEAGGKGEGQACRRGGGEGRQEEESGTVTRGYAL